MPTLPTSKWCCQQAGHEVLLAVQDNGKGFVSLGDSQRHAKQRGGGHGVSGMKHRTQMFNGTLRVSSALGQGTRVEARIPLHEWLAKAS
ncbi:MAG: hypothetical protein HC848_06935 [Limnobacter sp.]|nr:hypothetical protein [Limnobacter sp.]